MVPRRVRGPRLGYSFRASRAFMRSCALPHRRHRVARTAFRALHFMQIFLWRVRASASANRAIAGAKRPGVMKASGGERVSGSLPSDHPMRIWDLPPARLCDRHLLAEHRELHAVWTVLTEGKRGYANHPETRRWRGKEKALFRRHGRLVREFRVRGFRHASALDRTLAVGSGVQTRYVDSPREQRRILGGKGCACRVGVEEEG